MIVLEFERRISKAGAQRDWVLTASSNPESVLMSTWQRVSEFKPTEADEPRDNDSAKLKCAIWEKTIQPAYEAWQKGAAMPETGTPLSAWLELNRHQVKALNSAGINTVEQVAEMNDTAMGQIQLLNKQALKRNAKIFLRSMSDRTEKIDEQAEKIRALEEQLAGLVKRPVGRPRKEA